MWAPSPARGPAQPGAHPTSRARPPSPAQCPTGRKPPARRSTSPSWTRRETLMSPSIRLAMHGTLGAVFALVILAGLLAGCATGPASQPVEVLDPKADPVAPKGTGSVKVSVTWPEVEAELVPSSAQSIHVVIESLDGSTVHAESTLDPANSSDTLSDIPAGDVRLRAAAYPEPGASGTAQASAAMQITVMHGDTTEAGLTLQSTIDTIEVTPAASTLRVNQSTTLTATAKDSDGNVVLVSGPWDWTTSDGTAVSLASSGTLPDGSGRMDVDALDRGTATIEATDAETGKASSATVQVTQVAGLTLGGNLGESSVGKVDQPDQIAFDSAGRMYVADHGRECLTVFDAAGDFVEHWTHAGSNALGTVTGVAIDRTSSWLYLTVSNAGQLSKLGLNGALLDDHREYGSGPGQFDGPSELAVDSSGNVYVVDRFNDRIQKFNSDLAYQLDFNASDSPNGTLTRPGDIAVDGSDNVWVADTNNSRICKFDTLGNLLSELEDGGRWTQPQGVGVDGGGNVYVASPTGVHRYTSALAYDSTWGPVPTGTDPGEVQFPLNLDIHPTDDDAYVCDYHEYHRFQRFSGTDGSFEREWQWSWDGDGEFSGLPNLEVSPLSGEIFVTDPDNHSVQRFHSTGSFYERWGTQGTGPGELLWPHGVGVGSDGSVYILMSTSAHAPIQKFGPNGAYENVAWGSSGTGNGEFVSARDLAVSPQGEVMVSDTNATVNRIQVFDGDGGYLRKYATTGSGPGQWYLPMGLATGPSGLLTVADSWNYRVQQVQASDGGHVHSWGTMGSADGQFMSLHDVATDGSGNVYTVDGSSKCVQVFDSEGNHILTQPIASNQLKTPKWCAVSLDGETLYVSGEPADVLAYTITWN
ncbi:MAG: hypothetical protein GF320_02645 [Armatimonadia bacterium]|nr:hypothetical protein [Armatimonadia bacterium]